MKTTTTAETASRDKSADKPGTSAGPLDTSGSFSDMATPPSASGGSGGGTGGHIEIETIEDDIDPETPDSGPRSRSNRKSAANDDLATSGDESELDPLQSNVSAKVDSDKDGTNQNACMEMGDEDCWSKDFDRDSQSPTTRKKGWDVRCLVIGFLVLLLVVGGALVITFAQRFKGETEYKFFFASYYGDHMVLQRAPHQAVIWGYGPMITDNTSVLVVLEGPGDVRYEYRTKVGKSDSDSTWRVLVGPIFNPGPFVITASLEDVEGYKIVIKDVLFGDIWVCIEQNKIHLSLNKLLNGTEDAQKSSSHYQNIRVFSLFPAKSDLPWYDLHGIQLPWTVPKSVMDEQVSQSHSNHHFPGVCWLFGKQLHDRLNYSIGLISVTYSDSAMKEWIPFSVHENCSIPITDSSSRIWNGMINPMLDMQVFGLIWHQGDQDANEPISNFDCALVEFIKLWRLEVIGRGGGSSKDLTLPVGIVQLAPKYASDQNVYSYSDIRWKQTANYGYLPNHRMQSTFLAVTIDLPETNSNHTGLRSGHKHDIVGRLVQGAWSVAYKRGNRARLEPFPITYSASTGSLTLTFEPPKISVRTEDGFEICCSKNRTHDCTIKNSDIEKKQEWMSTLIKFSPPTSITLTAPACNGHIVAVRYAWRDVPCSLKSCAIYGGEHNFPMPPYIHFNLTDDGSTHPLDKHPVRIP